MESQHPQKASKNAADLSINVCFSTTDALISRVIRWFTRSTVSHALITYRSQTLAKVMVMEATGRGFNVIPWSRWRQHNKLMARFSIEVDRDVQLDALRGIAEELGTEYDKLSLLALVVRRWKRRAANPLDDPTKLICSEAVALFLNKARVQGMDDPGSWTPADLLSHAASHPDVFTREEADQTYNEVEASLKRA